ncbi:bacteriocin immunity protein [Vagococcus luciliae]|uniref:Lactococcin-A immunity protein n=1 Tax=Vagococcus luciliae TaxID=2920380 RepID=A0ABY5P1N3_9ENTE|nr:bacteriocin immunity protein [Vagococcus luciliae]UUV99840.1 Lactococcin-A immunity protein [Vagococcus luciliae]
MTKKANSQDILDMINELLTKELTNKEKNIFVQAKLALESKHYLPRVTADLRSSLTPLAMSNQLSKETGELYLTITNYPYTNNNLGGGLISVFGNNLK